MRNKYYLVEKATMRCLVDTVSKKYGKTLAISKYGDALSEVSYRQLAHRVRSVSAFLLENGMKQGDKIMIAGESGPHWVIAYLGITYAGMTAVTVLPNFSSDEMNKIVEHSQVKMIFVTSPNLGKIVHCGLPIVRLDDFVAIPSSSINPEAMYNTAEALKMPGLPVSTIIPTKKTETQINQIEIEEDDVASIIYTSGTTGTPKGVMLTHRNLIWNADACSKPFIHLKRGWRILSILPLAHVYEFTVGLILPLLEGCSIVYLGKAPSVSSLMPALKDVRPRVLLSVPLLIEKIYNKAVAPQVNGNPKIKRLLGIPLINRFVYHAINHKLISSLGSKLKFFGVGGAPLDPQVEKFLDRAGFPYALGYGLTETSPFIAGCGPKDHKVGTLGKVLPGVKVRLDPETGEIQTKSPSVMKGYYRNDELTRECRTEDGWFCTGDTGLFRKKRLVLSGRIKDMILTSNGENIFPEAIENIMNHQEFVQESLIIPENGGLLALIKLDMDTFAANLKMDIEEARKEALKYIQKLRENVNNQLSSSSKISGVEIQDDPLERTPTMKIKRLAIIKKRQKTNQQENNTNQH
jgi:long-chain acyl-CoA synthetase